MIAIHTRLMRVTKIEEAEEGHCSSFRATLYQNNEKRKDEGDKQTFADEIECLIYDSSKSGWKKKKKKKSFVNGIVNQSRH